MDIEQPGGMGLRERKKLATRESLAWAAMRLCVDRGLENVRVEDIAAAAGVSPRTFNNYFSSREEAICAVSGERAKRIGEALLARPADEPLGEALIHAMVEQYTRGAEPDRESASHFKMIMQNPALVGEFLKGARAMEANLAAAIAERAGLDPGRDLLPRVLAMAACGAARTATEYWLCAEPARPYSDLLREALGLVALMARETESRGGTGANPAVAASIPENTKP